MSIFATSSEIPRSTIIPGTLSTVTEIQVQGLLPKAKEGFKLTTAFILAFISVCVITLAAALDATSLSIALSTITEDLKGLAIEAFWSGTSFLLTSAVFQPVIAGLSHIFGRKDVSIAILYLRIAHDIHVTY